jgi:carboxypeptidase family protein
MADPTPTPVPTSPGPTPTPVPASPGPTPTPTPASPATPGQLNDAGNAADSSGGSGDVGGTSPPCAHADPADIAVRVVTSTGKPVEGVAVSTDQGQTGTTGPDGVYDFGEVPPGTYTVSGQKDNYGPPGGTTAGPNSDSRAAAAGTSTQFELVLDPIGAEMSVHVQTPDGSAVEGVTVSVDGKGWSGVTDKDGNFDFGQVPPDTYTVKAEKDGYDLTSASQTQNVPVNASTQFTIVLTPLHAKIDVDGVTEANKTTVGGLIVRKFDNNNAPRKKITISMKSFPAGSKADILLQNASDKIKIFDAATAGSEITIDGTANKFAGGSLPKDFWIEGINASDSMRDIEISVDVAGVKTKDDSAKLTVLWVDKPTVALSGTTSPNNDKKAAYKAWTKANTDNLGLQEYNATMGARMGWGSEASAKVNPTKFDFPGNDLKLERDYDYRDINGTVVMNSGARSASVPPGNDTGPASARDDNPDPDDMLYDFDAAGLGIPNAPVNTIHRTRNNFWAFASITVEGKAVRCSEIREYFISFSQKQTAAPSGSTWVVINPPDVAGDMTAGNGTTKITWDLK